LRRRQGAQAAASAVHQQPAPRQEQRVQGEAAHPTSPCSRSAVVGCAEPRAQ
jgi:hypothetical protein